MNIQIGGVAARRHMLSLAVAFATGLALLASVPPALAAGNNGPAISPVGRAPAIPSKAALIGSTPGSQALHFDIVLNSRNPAGLQAFAMAVSTPGSPERGHFLTVRQFAARFGQPPATIRAAIAALRGTGLAPGRAAANGLVIPVYTTFKKAALALHTRFVNYRLSSGRVAFANTSAPRLPSSLARLTTGVIGLDDLVAPAISPPRGVGGHRAGSRVRQQPQASGPTPCAAAVSAAEENDGWTYNQLASVYGLSSLYADGYEGQGVRVALFELDAWEKSDEQGFQSCYGEKVPVIAHNVNGGAGTGPGEGEAALDMDTIIGLAPRVKLTVWDAPTAFSSYGTEVVDEYTDIFDSNNAQIVSASYAVCEQAADADFPGLLGSENTLFEQAASQGITVFAASGDTGSEGCSRSNGNDTELGVPDQASNPFVTGVGGTDLSSISPRTEVVWNDSTGAGGGGISDTWDMPSYQTGPGVINRYTSGTPCGNTSGDCREVPDVSASASPFNPYIIYYDGEWEAIGGTSAATPLWAAMLADIDSETYVPPSASDPNTTTAARLGLLNPTFYDAAADGTGFNDITVGNNDWTGAQGGKYPATANYDMASGLGTPIATELATAILDGADLAAVPPSIPAEVYRRG
jgi:subtilase family serine protease